MRQQYALTEGWWVKQLDGPNPDVAALSAEVGSPGDDWLQATMPAQVHDVLLAHGRIPDPRVGKQAAESAWVGEKDWAYGCTFASPTGEGPVLLRFKGLDTLATVYVNGAAVGRFSNMHRHYAVEVRAELAPPGDDNALLIIFASPLRFVNGVDAADGIAAHHHLRKCKSDFTSYLGARPHSVKVGVFDDVIVDVPDIAWLDDVWVRPVLSGDLTQARVHTRLTVERSDREQKLSIAWSLVDPSGAVVAQETTDDVVRAFEIDVDNPSLWWPRSHGEPQLYALTVTLLGPEGALDRRQVPFGIRRITPMLDDPATGEARFAFEVNGQRIFLRGACWAPLQGMTHCWNPARAATLFDLAEHAEMNAFRVWGGGIAPPASFYEACDRRGFLVWQDFMFGYSMHPDDDPAFVTECTSEIEETVRRLRNHPSLLLWCGGNENHMGWDFTYGTAPAFGDTLFGEVMPRTCAELDPDRFFHTSSPHGGPVPNWPLEGDWHDYTTLAFSPQASVPLFASETGRASAPSVSSMRRFMSEDELWPEGYDARVRAPGKPAWPPMWQYRSVDGSWDKVGAVETYCDPASADDLVRVLGTAHGEYLLDRISRHRRGVPDGQCTSTVLSEDEELIEDERELRGAMDYVGEVMAAEEGLVGENRTDGTSVDRRCWGTLIWRLNDPWPILYWSAVDAYNEPKIPYYFVRRAYAPVLVSFERTPDTIAAWVVNDGADPVSGTLTVRQAGFNGEVRAELEVPVTLRSGESRRCVDVTSFGPINLRSEFLWARLSTPSGELTTTYLLAGERALHLPEATLKVRQVEGGVEIATDVYARQVSLTMVDVTGAVFEDNFFDLAPGASRTVAVLQDAGGKTLRVGALNASTTEVGWQG